MSTSPRELEALRMFFEDDFDEVYARTRSYVKGLIGKNWWVSKKQLLDNEGPLESMVFNCMCYIAEEGDRIEGYKAYTSYLTKEYSSAITRNRQHASLEELRYTPALQSPQSLGTDTTVEEELGVLPEWLSKEQAEFLLLHKRVGMNETAEYLDMTPTQAWNKYRYIKKRVKANT